MSYQAITDIIVNPAKIQDLQLSNPVKDSQNLASSQSFSELVSFYKNENSPKTEEVNSASKEISKSEDRTEENAKTSESKSEEKVESKSESKKAESSDEKSEKVESKEETKTGKTDKSAKKVTLPENNTKEVSEKGEKSLDEKEFSKLNQLIEEGNNKNSDKIEISKKELNPKTDFTNDKKVKSEENSEVLEEIIPLQFENQLSSSVAKNVEDEDGEKDFDFAEKTSDGKKVYTLDKEGKITVEDLRTQISSEVENEKKSDLKITEVKQTSENSATITMDFNQSANNDVLSLNNQTAASNGSNFQQMLSNQIQNSAPEFVKAGNLVLKDNNQGTINLVLHPDDLGNVKIHLSLDGKSISGQITVATKEALQVFKDNAETLREAFIKNGFDAANFDVAFNNGGSFNGNSNFAQQNDGKQMVGRQLYQSNAEALDFELENIIQNTQDISNYSVNIVA